VLCLAKEKGAFVRRLAPPERVRASSLQKSKLHQDADIGVNLSLELLESREDG